MKSVFIQIQGIVQGVGFRPFIKNLADFCGIKGYVMNTSEGVEAKAVASETQIKEFLDKIIQDAPPISHIVSMNVSDISYENFDDFSIKPSEKFADKLTLVSPDLAICPECAAEIENRGERRFLYPFTNCTNCGPRYSITESLPYDRINTVMTDFEMCADCYKEYSNNLDRRFHAQPIACPNCGPSLKLNYKGTIITDNAKIIEMAAKAIDHGEIIAMKGLGGYHLICDAYNDNAIKKLRRVKKRGTKPLAVMVKDVSILDKYIKANYQARDIFLSPASPIVLFDWKDCPLSPLVNPVSGKIGVMRAYTPLHYLLFGALHTDVIVATSGNMRDEPIAANATEAENNLKDFTDIFLHHNRKIVNRVDDSVVAATEHGYTVLRRARGFAPFPVMIQAADKYKNSVVFAAGANLKSGMAFYKSGFAFLSQYIGDLDNVETEDFYGEVFNRMRRLFAIEPRIAVKDMHPDYRSSIFADNTGLKTIEIQHHVAHFASCLCENSHYGDAIGIVMDGFGLGADKMSGWGGEFFVKKGENVYRKAHLRPFIQPGLDAAAKHPCRMAVSYIYSAGLLGKYRKYFNEKLGMTDNEISLIKFAVDNKINSIYTSSAGRLFEAVGSIVLGERSNGYEGELAVNLESIAYKNIEEYYIFSAEGGVIDPSHVFADILDDMEKGLAAGIISAKFHNGFARAVCEICYQIAKDENIDTVALSGGVFQNIYLLESVSKNLSAASLRVLLHKKVPANDQGIALGQLYAVLLNLALKL